MLRASAAKCFAMKTLGELVREFRVLNGWNTARMAEAVKTSRQNIESLEASGFVLMVILHHLFALIAKLLALCKLICYSTQIAPTSDKTAPQRLVCQGAARQANHHLRSRH